MISASASQGEWDEYREQFVREDGSASPYESIPRSMWWCMVTMTTVGELPPRSRRDCARDATARSHPPRSTQVGYGDDYPVTVPGQVVAIITMFCGRARLRRSHRDCTPRLVRSLHVCSVRSLIVLSLPITIIGANFDELYRDMKKKAPKPAPAARETSPFTPPTPPPWQELEKRTRLARLSAAASNGRSRSPGGATHRRLPGFTPASAADAANSPIAAVHELIDASHVRLSKQARHTASPCAAPR